MNEYTPDERHETHDECVSSAPTVEVPDSPVEEYKEPPIRQRAPSVWKELGALCLKIVVIVAVTVLVFTFFYGFYRNADPDMAPMVKTGDLVLFYRLDRNYSAGDLLLLDFMGERQVRRVVAGAGDIVDMEDGYLIVNGAAQQEPDIFQQTHRYYNSVTFPLTVGYGQVFVLGDARSNATDSRVYGPVNVEDTLGTVITIIRRRNF